MREIFKIAQQKVTLFSLLSQLSPPKSFGLCISFDERVSPGFLFNNNDGFIDAWHSWLVLSNLREKRRSWGKSAKVDGPENNRRSCILRSLRIGWCFRSVSFVDFCQGNYAVWRRFRECSLLFSDIGLGPNILHGNLVLDTYLCLQHEAIFIKPTSTGKDLSLLRMVDIDSFHSHWMFIFVHSRCRVRFLSNISISYAKFIDTRFFSCHDIHDIGTAILRVMPNYVLNYGPILVVMIVNPILYVQCSKEVDKQLIQRYGQYTNNERQIHDMFKIKFSLINIIFFICWLPNIVNAILMWTMWFHLPVRIIIISWYIMAVLNPLQAFFNALVYRKWDNKLNCCSGLRNYLARKILGNVVNAQPALNEVSPLLQSSSTTPEPYTFSRNNTPRNSDENLHRYTIQCSCIWW